MAALNSGYMISDSAFVNRGGNLDVSEETRWKSGFRKRRYFLPDGTEVSEEEYNRVMNEPKMEYETEEQMNNRLEKEKIARNKAIDDYWRPDSIKVAGKDMPKPGWRDKYKCPECDYESNVYFEVCPICGYKMDLSNVERMRRYYGRA